jgi:tuftelin-interacting protein 11
VIDWEDMLPLYVMANLLEKFFFPKWQHVLTMWLTHNPNFDEISNWYRGWKGMIPIQLRNQPAIKGFENFSCDSIFFFNSSFAGKLNDALQLMNRAAMAVSQNQSLAFLTAQPPPPPPPTHREAQEVRLIFIVLHRVLIFSL